MIKVNIICPGGLKESYLKEAAAEYKKRLSRYCELTITETAAEKLPDKPSSAQVAAALEKEAKAILAAVPQRAFTVALCVEGKPLSSEAFAKKLNEISVTDSNIAFIIGSSYGLSDTVKQKAQLKLSVSEMTFPHRLFRIMLLEQIYRAFKINEGGAYHK